MADYAKVNPHDQLSIPAVAYNNWQDAAKAIRGGALSGIGGAGAMMIRTPNIILCKNDDGAPMSTGQAVCFTQPIFVPTKPGEVTLKIKTPVAGNKLTWGILTGALPAGGLGTVLSMGDVVCQINLTTVADTAVDVSGGGPMPAGGSSGPAQIVWVAGWETTPGTASSTGVQWAIIRLVGAGSDSDVGTVQGQVKQMISDNQPGWGFVFMVPMD